MINIVDGSVAVFIFKTVQTLQCTALVEVLIKNTEALNK